MKDRGSHIYVFTLICFANANGKDLGKHGYWYSLPF